MGEMPLTTFQIPFIVRLPFLSSLQMGLKIPEKDEEHHTRKREPRCWSCANDHKACIFLDGELPMKCEHCKFRGLECSGPEPPTLLAQASPLKRPGPHGEAISPSKRRTQNSRTSSPSALGRRTTIPSNPPSTLHTRPGTPASDSENAVRTNNQDESAAELLLTMSGQPSIANIGGRTPRSTVIHPVTDRSTRPGTPSIDVNNVLGRSNEISESLYNAQNTNNQIINESSVDSELVDPAISKSLERMFVLFQKQNPDLNQTECMEAIKTTCLPEAGQIKARRPTEPSVPASPQLQSDTATTASVRSASPCLSSGSPPPEFRTPATPRPRNVHNIRKILSTPQLRNLDLMGIRRC
ncbi:hypothetical protein BDD12DRAFT_810152 [Trichophaea hybrida]|nr:hypothetical protein BDD12DRAFT_810152 [Trichophaea hybrida]